MTQKKEDQWEQERGKTANAVLQTGYKWVKVACEPSPDMESKIKLDCEIRKPY